MKFGHIIAWILISLFLLGCNEETQEEDTRYIVVTPKEYTMTIMLTSPNDEVKTAFFSPEFTQIGEVVELPFVYHEKVHSADHVYYYCYKNQSFGTLVMSAYLDNKPLTAVVTNKEFRIEQPTIEGFIIDQASEVVFFPNDPYPEVRDHKEYPDIIYWNEIDNYWDLNLVYPGS